MFEYTKAELTVLPIALLITVAIGLLVGWLLRKQTDKVKNLALVAVVSIMLIMEVMKQIKSFENGSYNLWNIPLHFCSMFMLWFSLAAFSKGRLKEVGMSLSNGTAYMFMLVFYISPLSIIGGASANVFGNFGSFHTFFYHHFIILFWLLQITLKLHKPKWADLKWIFIAFVIYFAVAAPVANWLDTNYASILFNILGFLDYVRLTFGYGWYLAMMFAIGAGGTMLFHTLTMLGYQAVKKCKNKQEKPVKQIQVS